jgi:hypothetical protein
MAKQNTQLESEGAEFLVLGQLLIEGVPAYKAYTRNRGYDLIATKPESNRAARIQVKSRWATDFDGGFIVSDTSNCDFVVFVALNRGYRFKKKQTGQDGKKEPTYYVFPAEVVQGAIYEKSGWGKAFLKLIPNVGRYERNWELVKRFPNSDLPALGLDDSAAAPRTTEPEGQTS